MNHLWKYSLTVYRSPEVKKFCLEVQTTWSANINIILFCGFLGSQGYVIDRFSVKKIVTISDWNEKITLAIRRLRNSIKSYNSGLYQRALSVELSAEEVEQYQLYFWWERNQYRLNLMNEVMDGSDIVLNNLRIYRQFMHEEEENIQQGDEDVDRLKSLSKYLNLKNFSAIEVIGVKTEK